MNYIYDSTGLAFAVVDLLDNTNYSISTGRYIYYVTRNAQGDVTALTDITNGYMGDKLRYSYSAYGMKVTGGSGDICKLASVCSIQYKGYSYDSDLGMYYLGARWYDPETARFLNGDSYVSTGQDLTGYNMFAYCGNNPINRADPDGEFWGIVIGITLAVGLVASLSGCSAKPEPYRSADDAARAFSEQVYSSSSYIRHEYSTEIYSRDINGETTYNYNPPRAGKPHSASVGNSTPKGTKSVAYAHTHPNSNVFSEADIRAARNLKIDAYVVGPNLELQRYSLSSASITNLGVISPIALTDAQRSSLVAEFQVLWDAHVAEGCDFNCGNMTWPTP